MCGIVGYTGNKEAAGLLIDGLKTLEYRGYDSAGIAIVKDGHLWVDKSIGRVNQLEKQIGDKYASIHCGIAHTRWATHGKVTTENAHPHVSNDVSIAIVHNGVIDNADDLRAKLKEDYKFESETDSEVIVHLIHKYYKDNTSLDAFRMALKDLNGTYGIAVVFKDWPEIIYIAKNGSPLVIGVGDKEHFIASDSSALIKHTNRVVYMEDGQYGLIYPHGFVLYEKEKELKPSITEISDEFGVPDKGTYNHFMLKEINEQPRSVERCFSGRILKNTCKLGGFNLTYNELATASQIIIIACGTSYHAGLAASYNIEGIAHIPCSVELASEFYTRQFLPDLNAIYLVISQSGETYDTLECVKELKIKGCKVFGIINVVGSSIARECGSGMYIHAGPEVAVASTKAFTSQLAALNMFALAAARSLNLGHGKGYGLAKGLKSIPDAMDYYLKWSFTGVRQASLIKFAEEIADSPYVLFLGRGADYPVAMEGALKLKEIAYVPCEAYSAGEMKHGPIAMIEEGTPVIDLLSQCNNKERMLANLEEVKARGAKIYLISNTMLDKSLITNNFIKIPEVCPEFSPMISVIPLQLIAYYAALHKGLDVDKPRNLAKSVTVG